MAHEVESLMYTSNEQNERFVPWHGLGTPVLEAPTSAEALKIAQLDWTVMQKPVFVDNNVIPEYIANVRNTDNSVLGIVSPKYKIVQNTEAFDFTDNLIGGDVRYETAGSLKKGKTVFLLAKLPQTTLVGDKVDPYICFTNTHDGSGAVRVCVTPVRVVCNNTLNVALNTAKRSWSTRHMGDMSTKLWEAKHTLELTDRYMEQLSKYSDRAANIKVTDERIKEIVNEMFPINDDDSDRKKTNMLKAKNEFYECVYAVDLRPFMFTAWGVANAAADFATHAKAQRMTDTFKENNFARILDGRSILDVVTEKLAVPMN